MKNFSHCWMMAVLLTGICAGVLVGCSGKREVTGQVFVVTNARIFSSVVCRFPFIVYSLSWLPRLSIPLA